MSKRFFEVFPYVEVGDRLKTLMNEVYVEKIVNVSHPSFLRVHIQSKHLIQKKDINEIEYCLNEMLSNAGDFREIILHEHFSLSDQYHAQTLMDMYKDSILLELKEYSPILYVLFKKAEITYPQKNHMHIVLQDMEFVRMMQIRLAEILEKIFIERCNLPVEFSYEFVEAGTKAEEDFFVEVKKHKKMQITNEVVEEVKKEKLPFDSGDKDKNTKNGKKAEYRRSVKVPDNPDIIFGKDIPEEAMKIEEMIGELGEVVVRGQVISMSENKTNINWLACIYDAYHLNPYNMGISKE